ncbi:MAG: TolC family protein [Tannerellaceae bacterium]|jgi:outer membrane protein TolC|nr:TolC family protein [Tannerellaceae bacterium]
MHYGDCKWLPVAFLFVTGIQQVTAQKVYSLERCIVTGLERNYGLRIVRNAETVTRNNATPGNAGYLPDLEVEGSLSDGAWIDAGLSLNWTLFDGFAIQASYVRLKELQAMGMLRTRQAIEDFVAEIAGEYYNLIRQQTRFNNVRTSFELSKERLRIVEQRYRIGSMSRLDLQQAQVDFNADSSSVLTQRETVHRCRIRLNELMALEDVEAVTVPADSTIDLRCALGNEEELWVNTLAANTGLLLTEGERRVSELEYQRLRGRNYPYLKATAGYGYSARWDKLKSDNTGTGLNYGLTLGMTLFDGLNRRREQRNARLEIENSNWRYADLELSLRATLSNLWMSYQNNRDLCNLERANSLVAQEYYAIAIDRYKLGDLSGIELREAQSKLLDAEERRSIVEYNTKLCEISLLQLSGRISEIWQ